jgi:toxin ParE1/3/4
MPRVRLHAAARRDLEDHAAYLMENAGEAVGERFLSAARTSLGLLAEQPMMGAPIATRPGRTAEIRKWAVSGFPDYLVFYQPRTEGVTVVRVLHAARDWWRLLGVH